jgi:nucleotide-binding universal stress UspA family protein
MEATTQPNNTAAPGGQPNNTAAPGGQPTNTASAPGDAGHVDVLVGVDGSDDSLAALHSVVDLLGPRLGRLGLAMVLPEDDGSGIVAATAMLRGHAARVAADRVETVVLVGPHAGALTKHAAAHDYDMIAVGSRSRWRSRSVLGGVTTAVASDGTIPVFVAAT